MGSVTKRKFLGAMADCGTCGANYDGDHAFAWARRHAIKTGHTAFVNAEYSVKQRYRTAEPGEMK